MKELLELRKFIDKDVRNKIDKKISLEYINHNYIVGFKAAVDMIYEEIERLISEYTDIYGCDTPRDWQSYDSEQRFFKPK